MDIFALIQQDHAEAIEMIDALQKRTLGKVSPQTRQAINDLVLTLRLRAKTVEVAFYEILEFSEAGMRQFCLEGYNEHDLVDTMLDKLLLLPPGDEEELTATLAVCKDLLIHHAEKKAANMAKIKDIFTTEQLLEMAAIMNEEKERLRPALLAQLEELANGEPPMRDTVPLSRSASGMIDDLRMLS